MFCVVDTELCLHLARNRAQGTDATPVQTGDTRGLIPAAVVTLIAFALCLGAVSWS
jgi:hypothetical protein